MALNLELTDTFYLWVLSEQISCMLLSFCTFSFNSIPFSGCLGLLGINPNKKGLVDHPKNVTFFLISVMVPGPFFQVEILRVFSRSVATRAVSPSIFQCFGSVWHAAHLHKLKSYVILCWVFSFLSSFLDNILIFKVD